jgi:hypothetical protein
LYSFGTRPHLAFDAVVMPAAEAFDFAVEFEVAADLGVVEDAEAVDDGGGAADFSGFGCIGMD